MFTCTGSSDSGSIGSGLTGSVQRSCIERTAAALPCGGMPSVQNWKNAARPFAGIISGFLRPAATGFATSKLIGTGRFSPNPRSFWSKRIGTGRDSVDRDRTAEKAMTVLGQTGELNRLPASKGSEALATWAALVSACAAWMFDAMDLQIFTLILFPSVSDLVESVNPGVVAYTGGIIVGWKLVALGLGGIAFGIAADRIGRARTMILTVLIYSVFTGLSGLAQSWWQLLILQACAGIGIGGEWAAGAALVAETWPERTRARALVIMQMSFAIGFFLAALLNLVIGPIGWRYVFAAGAAPALMTLLVQMTVPEPQRWLAARREARSIGGLRD